MGRQIQQSYITDRKSWWIVYTSRRANVPCHNVSWVHGTDLGVASSSDHGKTWLYRGTLNVEAIEPGRNTFWAPEILWADGCYHMFVSHITGVPTHWKYGRRILHYTSVNLWDWTFQGEVALGSDRVIDACVHAISGGWRMHLIIHHFIGVREGAGFIGDQFNSFTVIQPKDDLRPRITRTGYDLIASQRVFLRLRSDGQRCTKRTGIF